MEQMKLHTNQESRSRLGGMRRQSRRREVVDFTCDIAGKHRLFGGLVENVSINGFKVSHVDESFLADAHTYQTVIFGNGKYFRMIAKPCWKIRTEEGLQVGFKIIDSPWEWTEMILQTVEGKNLYSRIKGCA